ncbi:bacillithiol biosynthesis cysteine-adding enzyme BshC [Bacillaceae bacterium]
MFVEEIELPSLNALASDYVHSFTKVQPFFAYDPFALTSFRERKQWLDERRYPREQLVEGLYAFNREIGNHEEALANIRSLRNQDTYVVIGGQQAGVAVGPLYTVHKILTILQLARRLEEALQAKVIPVFWIAGEDHDYGEVNHLYVQTRDHRLEKLRLAFEAQGRRSLSHLQVPSAAVKQLLDEFFRKQIETEYTSPLREKLFALADGSRTLVEFFAKCLAWLFGHHGLVLVDSASAFLRHLETPVFRRLIEENEAVGACVLAQAEEVRKRGYSLQLELKEDQAHFFLYSQGERLLVERKGGAFVPKDGDRSYTREELLTRLEAAPESFSANVVSRPLMQETIFPTLAFVAGPGEIAYWALFKKMFAHMGLQLPVIVPRMSFTLLEGTIEKYLRRFGLNVKDVYAGIDEARDAWLAAQDDLQLPELFFHLKQKLETLYEPVFEILSQINEGLKELGEKNLEKVKEQVDYLERRAIQAFEHKHASALRQFERIKLALLPNDKPQERIYNVFSYLNKYGFAWLEALVEHPLAPNGKHKVVHLSSET